MNDQRSAQDKAIEILCASHLHQVLWLSQNALHDRLRITFSTTSNFDDTTLPVVLFCPPMIGSRLSNIAWDHTAKQHGIRVISVDRPGMGGSTPVPLDIRVKVWLETVPAILQHLNVTHIDLLLAHSAGTIYAFNTLYNLRELLHPSHPHVVFVAPWIHSEHTDAMLMGLASKLPKGVLGSWNQVAKFINFHVMPVTSWSGGVVSSFTGLFQKDSEAKDSTTPGERYGTSEEIGTVIENLKTKYFFAEDTTAANDDAILCLKKCEPANWGVCWDYKGCVQKIVDQEQSRQLGPAQPKLRVDAHFAETDVMIGKGGKTYFEECWRQPGVADYVQFESKELPGTDHDSAITDLKKGALQSIFAELSTLITSS